MPPKRKAPNALHSSNVQLKAEVTTETEVFNPTYTEMIDSFITLPGDEGYIEDFDHPVASVQVRTKAGTSQETRDGSWVKVDVEVTSLVHYTQDVPEKAELATQAAFDISVRHLSEFLEDTFDTVTRSKER